MVDTATPLETEKLDEVINQLLDSRGKRTLIDKAIVSRICSDVRTVFLEEETMLKLEGPIHICGDIHGQFVDLLRIFDYGGKPSDKQKYLFLGDFVDRGYQSSECILLMLALKLRFPKSFYMTRGNHESADVNRMYGFYDEMKTRYSISTWKLFQDVFNSMPAAALISKKIFCCHGGLSPDLVFLKDIEEIKRPTEVGEKGILCDLLWSDPGNGEYMWDDNDRGKSHVWNKVALEDFNERCKIDLVVRAHQVVEDGYEFFGNRQAVTIFSAPNYCGTFDNMGAMLMVDDELLCSFATFKSTNPVPKPKKKDMKPYDPDDDEYI